MSETATVSHDDQLRAIADSIDEIEDEQLQADMRFLLSMALDRSAEPDQSAREWCCVEAQISLTDAHWYIVISDGHAVYTVKVPFEKMVKGATPPPATFSPATFYGTPIIVPSATTSMPYPLSPPATSFSGIMK